MNDYCTVDLMTKPWRHNSTAAFNTMTGDDSMTKPWRHNSAAAFNTMTADSMWRGNSATAFNVEAMTERMVFPVVTMTMDSILII